MRSISRYWIIPVAAAVVVAIAFAVSMRSRSLSHLIDQLPGAKRFDRGIGWQSMSNHPSEEAVQAIRVVGTNALPYLMTELNAPDGSREKFKEAWDHFKEFWQSLIIHGTTTPGPPSVPNDEMTSGQLRRWRAVLAIHALGPMAKPAVPLLITKLKSPVGDGEGCVEGAYALSAMGQDGLKPLLNVLTNTSPAWDWPQLSIIWALGQTPEAGRQAVPQLLEKLHDKDWVIQMGTIWTLGQLHTNEEEIVPALASKLGDKSPNIKPMATDALKAYGFSVKRTALKDYLTNSKPYIRMAATNAYLALYPDEAAKLGLK